MPTPDAGVGSGSVGVISFGGTGAQAPNGQTPDEVPAPEHDAGTVTDTEPPAEPGDADVAEPADTDPQAEPQAQPVADDTTTPDDADDSTIGEEEGIS